MNNAFTSHCLRRQLSLFYFTFLAMSFLSAQLPAGFVNAKIQGNYTAPMGVVFSKNGQKMFVWEKKGTIWVSTWNGGMYVKQTIPVIDISEEVGNWRDYGFQSMALDPNFDTNGLIYLSYQVDKHHLLHFGTPQYIATKDEYFSATISRLTRYQLVASGSNLVANLPSRKILFGETISTSAPILHDSHAGGQVLFGTDGSLLVSTGDGANYIGVDAGSAADTYWEEAITQGIMRTTENVGSFRSQMINSFSGKILRLDPNTGNALPSNPYYDAANPRSAKSRVWALGLRNPYRMALKTGTGSTVITAGSPGTLLVADVQWGQQEELHVLEKAGLNCGWPLFEGITTLFPYFDLTTKNAEEPGSPLFSSLCVQATSTTINPVVAQRRFTHAVPTLDWSHNQVLARYPDFSTDSLVAKAIGSVGAHVAGKSFMGNAGTSGTYYTGAVFPLKYRNVFFFADYGANWIKAAVIHDNSDHQVHEVLDFAPPGFGKGIVNITFCPVDSSIFYVNINTGEILRISYGPANQPPVAVATSNKTFGPSPLTVNFSSLGSKDPENKPLTYEWDFGDGTPKSALANPSHVFTATGIKGFTVTLTVRDIQGISDAQTIVISVNNTPPSVKITNPVNNSLYPVNTVSNYILTSTVTDNNVTGMKYAWQVILRHNNHEHREPINTLQSPTIPISPVGCDGETYSYMIELTVTDNGGLKSKDSVKIFPDCSTANLAVKNLAATAQQNAVRLNWVNPTASFTEIMVVAKPNTGFLSSPSGINYVADPNFKGDGSPFEGGKVVLKSKVTTVTVSNLTGGTKYFFRVYTRVGTAWTGGVEISATPTGGAAVCDGDGKLYVETWNNISDSNCVADIPLTTPPTTALTRTYARFETTSNAAERYGMRIRGFICAPETGPYSFYIASDDGGNLYLSTNTDAANKRLIAEMPNCTWAASRQWTKFDEQKSEPINLVAGQKYYVEVLFKEGTDGDNLAIGWQLPSNPTGAVQVIPNTSLTAFVPPTATVFDPIKCYQVKSVLSGKVMEVASGSLTSGANVVQRGYTVVGLKHQLWKFKDNGDGSYRMVNANSGKIADVSGGLPDVGTPIIQWDWNTDDNQRWIFTKNTQGFYKVAAKHSNLALSVANNSLADGAQLLQNTPVATNTGQQWEITALTCPAGVVPSESANLFFATGYRDVKKAVISWVSNANEQKDYFMVEKINSNASNFEKLEILNVRSNQTGNQSYSVTDAEPHEGDNLYRVALYRQGETLPQYSEVIKVNFDKLYDYLLFPNPASDYLDVDLETVRHRKVTISITNLAGHVLKQEKIASATEEPVRLSLHGLVEGSYLVKIQTEGRREVTKPFVLMRE